MNCTEEKVFRLCVKYDLDYTKIKQHDRKKTIVLDRDMCATIIQKWWREKRKYMLDIRKSVIWQRRKNRKIKHQWECTCNEC